MRMVEASLRAANLPHLDLQIFDLRDPDVEAFVSGVEAMDADVVGCSTYLWSFPTSIEVARRLKANCRDRLIVFGGPSARPSMLGLEPFRGATSFVDALVIGEGEGTFVDIVTARDRSRASLRNIPGLALWQTSGWEHTAPRSLVDDLDALPSPYRLGFLSHRGLGGFGVLNHYRGCPYKCSFCEWGALENPKRVLSAAAISAEVEAMADARADGVLCVDAGLNINTFAFENLSAAIQRTGALAKKRFSCEVYPTHLTKRQLEFLESLGRPDVGIGLQSWEKGVLANLDRPFDDERFEERVVQLAQVADVTIEIILGLPGDDLARFKRTFERARALPAALRVFHAVVLPSALMVRAPEHFAMEYDPYSLKMEACLGWSRDDLEEACRYVADATAQGRGYTGDYLWLFPSAHTLAGQSLPAGVSGSNRDADTARFPSPVELRGPARAGEAEGAKRDDGAESFPADGVSPPTEPRTEPSKPAAATAVDPAGASPGNGTPAQGPVRDLFRRGGLRPGRVVAGWTVNSVDMGEEGEVAFANFSRGSPTIRVRFRRAGTAPRFARVGALDISHDEVDAALNREVGLLLRVIVAWVKQRDIGADLVRLLAASADPRGPSATSSPPEDASKVHGR
jgi:radical SAM superfamily enzyme YgiQ (UPF0313 family)